MKKGYIAALLSQELREELQARATFPTVHCRQVTMAYNPSEEVFAKYEHLLGKTVDVTVTAIISDDLGQAAVVTGVPTENAYAHITISTAKGTAPVYSNTMLGKPEREQHWTLITITGKAVVQFMQHQGVPRRQIRHPHTGELCA